MKVIFSRKGFDSAAGGCPSPILDGQPISLPIPTKMPTTTCYADLLGPYATLVSDLTGGRLKGGDWCHVEPDIVTETLPRASGWRGALGQVSTAQAHLANNEVGPGDLFLFWGLFRPVESVGGKWRFVGSPEHRIWGWLQVGEILNLGPDGSHALDRYPWLVAHPHVRAGWGSRNVLYLASDQFEIGERVLAGQGSGALRCGHRLTSGGAGPSLWRVPSWLHPTEGGSGMTYHPTDRWMDDLLVRAASRGQEFVARPVETSAVVDWVASLLEGSP